MTPRNAFRWLGVVFALSSSAPAQAADPGAVPLTTERLSERRVIRQSHLAAVLAPRSLGEREISLVEESAVQAPAAKCGHALT